jgi:hypothetical protein
MTEQPDPMDERLRTYAERWREAAPPPPIPDVDRLRSRPHARRTWWLVATSAAAVAVVIAGGTRLVGDDSTRRPPPPAETVKPGDVVPWAPLPATHPQIPTKTTPASPDPAEAVGKPDCRAADLHAATTIGAAAGTSYLTARLSLVGPHPCRLEGYPDLRLLDRGRQVDIPVRHQTDDSVYRDPVLVAAGQPAVVRLGWSSAWCTTPVHNDTIEVVLPSGTVRFAGFGGSPYCNGVAGSGPTPIKVATFSPVKTRDAGATTAYADLKVAGTLDITTSPNADVDFIVTLTSPQRIVLDPCPDYRIVQSGDGEPETESHALNCQAVTYKDDDGRPYLPAGTPVRFAMHATSGSAGVYKFNWLLDTVDLKGTGGTLTVAPVAPSAAATPAAQHKAALRAGVRTVQAFLDAYRREGLVVASRDYSASDQQVTSSAGVPRLSSGTVVDASVSSWNSPDDFTLEVTLDLHFDGDPLAWNQGLNDRFVTLTRTGGSLRLSFATSP